MQLLLRKPIWHQRIFRRVLGPLRTLKHSLRVTVLVSVLLCLFPFNPIFSATKTSRNISAWNPFYQQDDKSLFNLCQKDNERTATSSCQCGHSFRTQSKSPDLVKDKASLQCKAWMFTVEPLQLTSSFLQRKGKKTWWKHNYNAIHTKTLSAGMIT